MKPTRALVIGIKGAGEMASAVAWRLYMANFTSIFMMEIPRPLAVRRAVSFSEVVYENHQTIEGVRAMAAPDAGSVDRAWEKGCIAVRVDPAWTNVAQAKPDVVIDAILAKQNRGTRIDEAKLVIGLGPGFVAGRDVHVVIETNRGHHLGRIITHGRAEANTGTPGTVCGFSGERVLRAPRRGIFTTHLRIAEHVLADEEIGRVEDRPVYARIPGVIRGLLRTGTPVSKGLKLGDIDPRGDPGFCSTISDKARAISGSVLEAVLRVYHGIGAQIK